MPNKEPSRTKLRNARIAAESAALPKISKEVLEQIVADGPMTAQQVNATMMALKKAIIERALGGELSHHLGYTPGADRPAEADNHRNGASAKDRADRGWAAAHRGAARSGRQLRAAAHPQARTALHRL